MYVISYYVIKDAEPHTSFGYFTEFTIILTTHGDLIENELFNPLALRDIHNHD